MKKILIIQNHTRPQTDQNSVKKYVSRQTTKLLAIKETLSAVFMSFLPVIADFLDQVVIWNEQYQSPSNIGVAGKSRGITQKRNLGEVR